MIHLFGRFGPKGSVSLEGNGPGLAKLAKLIREGGELELATPASLFPYTDSLFRVDVADSKDKVEIVQEGDSLRVSGNRLSRDTLAGNLDMLAHGELACGHIHVEYHEGHFFLLPTSQGVVIERLDDEGSG